MRNHRTLLSLAAVLVVAGAALAGAPGAADEPKSAAATTAAPSFAADVSSAMDRKADPCVDFYRYACGGWLDTTRLPADQNRWARSFSVIRERNRALVREVLEKAAADPGSADSERGKIGCFYAACMDEAAIEKAGAEPLKSILAKVAAVDGPAALLALTGELHRDNVDVFFGTGVFPDFKNPGVNIALVAQGGIGLPDRDYYLSDDPKQQEILAAYEQHVARMLALLGEGAEDAAADARRVVAFETELARASRTRTEMRDLQRLYNKIDRAGLQKLTPELPWDRYFDGLGGPAVVDINVATPEFFSALARQIPAAAAAALRAYLTWQVVTAAADRLSSPFVDENFAFYGATLSGQQEIEPRWKRCVDATEGALGEAVGKVYVEDNFPGASKQVALEMIGDIEAAFESNLPKLAWMDDATRARAVEKKSAIQNKIGYPDQWRDYSRLAIGPRDGYYANSVAATAFETDRQLAKVGKPVDRGEWGFPPQTVNASYNPLLNDISFFAGIF